MRVLTSVDRDEISQLRGRGEFFWLDLAAPDESQLEALAELLDLHPIAVEGLREPAQRPKRDDYGDQVLIVFYGARHTAGEAPRMVEVELVVHGDYLISVHQEPLDELLDLHEQFGQRGRGSEGFVVYRVLDTLTDTFFPLLTAIDDEIDNIESEIIGQPTDAQLQRIFRLKRDLVAMRKVIAPQRDLFAGGGDDLLELPGLHAGARNYMRDVYDHLLRISELIDSYRDLLTGAMDVYLSTVSNRLNLVMKRLTVIATVFLPLSFVTGFFGQNFGWMTTRIGSLEAFLVLGIGSLLVSCVVLALWFRRSGID